MIRGSLRAAAWLAGLVASASLLGACASSSPAPAPTPPPPERRVPSNDPQELERRAQVRLQLAEAYFGQGQYDTALEEVRRSLAANPAFGPAYNLRALILAAQGDEGQAEESFRRALQINARDVDAMHNYGWFLCMRQRYPDAMAQFDQVLAIQRGAARTLTARGVCQARAGQWPEAEASLMRAYELDPSNPVTALNLSDVLVRRGELTRARFYIARVNAVPDNANPQTLWLAARIEHKLGNAVGARDFGERIRARFPQAAELLLFDRGRFDE